MVTKTWMITTRHQVFFQCVSKVIYYCFLFLGNCRAVCSEKFNQVKKIEIITVFGNLVLIKIDFSLLFFDISKLVKTTQFCVVLLTFFSLFANVVEYGLSKLQCCNQNNRYGRLCKVIALKNKIKYLLK